MSISEVWTFLVTSFIKETACPPLSLSHPGWLKGLCDASEPASTIEMPTRGQDSTLRSWMTLQGRITP